MATILVSGNLNLETNVKVNAFPVTYNPAQFVFFGIQSHVSGVGFNLTRSLRTLGDEVVLLSMIGDDILSSLVRAELQQMGVNDDFILPLATDTMQSVILYDEQGKRQIFSDLKDVQQLEYPIEIFSEAVKSCDLCLLTNLNANRPLLHQAKQLGKRIACDVQAIASLEDEYNLEFMEFADILFFSNDRLGERASALVCEAASRFPAKIIVSGMGEQGVYFYDRQLDWHGRIPAITPRPIINTVGAGDALFSSFIHFYLKHDDAQTAIRQAVLYAGWKIGESGGAKGFLTESELLQLAENHR